MYSLVLMLALSDSASVPAVSPVSGLTNPGPSAHQLNRGCRGCWGCHGCRGCRGCHGCYGGCYGSWGGCHGCWGGCYGGWYGGMSHGCCGGIVYGGVALPPGPPPGGMEKKGGNGDKKDGMEISAPATIEVSLPADAKLTIDDAPTASTTASRSFRSPPLEPGKTFYYTLKAEVVRDGKTLTKEQRVQVRAGQATPVTIDFSDAAVAAR